MRRRAVAAASSLLATSAWAAAPNLDALYPAGGQAGSEFEVRAIGKIDPWPCEAWCSAAGVILRALDKPGRFTATIAGDAHPGPCLVRLHNAEGASDARIFVIGTHPEVSEQNNNNAVKQAEEVDAFPVVVNGRLEKRGDVDFYRLKLKKGQCVHARVDGYALRSPIDPFLHLLDAQGFELELASDGHNLDPHLDWTAPADSDYLFQVAALDAKASANVTYSGAENAVYRLVIEAGPPEIALPAADRQEQEGKEPMRLEPPLTVLGRIGKPGERDRYVFNGAKGKSYRIAVEADRHRSPMDAVFTVHREKGPPLGTYDDRNSQKDPEYLLKAAGTEYTVEISDRFRRGGPPYFYRLVIEEPKPEFRVTAEKDRLVIEAGKAADLKLKLERLNGHKAPLELKLDGLPESLGLDAPMIPEKTGDITLTLKAKDSAKAWNGPLRIGLVEGDTVQAAVFSLKSGESRGDYLVNEVRAVWLTVKAKK